MADVLPAPGDDVGWPQLRTGSCEVPIPPADSAPAGEPGPTSWRNIFTGSAVDADVDLKLRYIAPCLEDGIKVAMGPIGELERNGEPWASSLVGYVLDKRSAYLPFHKTLENLWKPKVNLDIFSWEHGLFILKFIYPEDLSEKSKKVGVIGNLVHSSPNIKKEVLLVGALQLVIGLLSSCRTGSQREAALLLGQFAATDSDCKVNIVQRGAVKPLIDMLQSPDVQLKEMSAFALGRLAQNSTLSQDTIHAVSLASRSCRTINQHLHDSDTYSSPGSENAGYNFEKADEAEGLLKLALLLNLTTL